MKLWQLTALLAAVLVGSCYLAHLMPPPPRPSSFEPQDDPPPKPPPVEK